LVLQSVGDIVLVVSSVVGDIEVVYVTSSVVYHGLMLLQMVDDVEIVFVTSIAICHHLMLL
jgi:hypothetical protein